MTTNHSGNDKIRPLTKTYPQIEKRLVTDENTNELYVPLSSTMVLKRKKGRLYVILEIKNSLSVDASVHSRACISAFAQLEMK